MKPFITVLRREVAEHRLLLAGACLISLFPLLIPFVPGIARSSSDVAELRGGAALILAGLVSTLLAVILGATVLARDLSERRLGFYFSRPISGLAIWAGKTLAALAVTLTAGAVILLPAGLLGDFENISRLSGWVSGISILQRWSSGLVLAALWTALLLVLLLVAHTVSSMVRSRNAWLLLDLAAAVLIAGLLAAGYGRLAGQGAFLVAQLLLFALLALFVLALVAANLTQILHGRTELHRGHRWLSSVLWSVLLTGSLAFAGYSQWLSRAEPADLRRILEARSAPAGDWVYLAGTTAGHLRHGSIFLLQPSSGRFVRVMPMHPDWFYQKIAFSDDGSWAAWVEAPGKTATLVRLDLKASEPRPVRHAIREMPGLIVLSQDGSRLALRFRDRLLVEETATARLLASVPLPLYEDVTLHFRDPGHVLLVRSEGSLGGDATVVEELDIATGKVSRISTLLGIAWSRSALSPDGRRILLRNYKGRTILLFDVETGEQLSQLQFPYRVEAPGEALFLSDGRIVVSRWNKAGTEMRLFDQDGGRTLQTFRWPDYRSVVIGGELPSGQLAVTFGLREKSALGDRFQGAILDPARGTTRLLSPGMISFWYPEGGTGAVQSRLFLRNRKELVRIDPKTGEFQKILTLS